MVRGMLALMRVGTHAYAKLRTAALTVQQPNAQPGPRGPLTVTVLPDQPK